MEEIQENAKKVNEDTIEVNYDVWGWEYVLRKMEGSKLGAILDKELPDTYSATIYTLGPDYLTREELSAFVRQNWGLKGLFQVVSVRFLGKSFVPVEELLRLNIPLLQKNKFLKVLNMPLLKDNKEIKIE